MQAKTEQKNKAIELRRQGFSYSEILGQIPVAKSSLSLWLRSVELSRKQKQKITDKKLASALRGARRRKEIRIALTKKIKDEGKIEVGEITKRELWLIGISLYWGEGNKEKEYRPGSGVKFSNSDPIMIALFLKWLLEIVKEPRENICFEIYLHQKSRERETEVKKFWENITNFSSKSFTKTRWKKNKLRTNRKNVNNNYFGLLRINVIRSSSLNRRISGWISGICEYCGVV